MQEISLSLGRKKDYESLNKTSKNKRGDIIVKGTAQAKKGEKIKIVAIAPKQ